MKVAVKKEEKKIETDDDVVEAEGSFLNDKQLIVHGNLQDYEI